MVLIFCMDKYAKKLQHNFPSPYGDYGSYRNYPVKEGWANLIAFPSPYGDYGSYLGIGRIDIYVVEWFPSPYGDHGSYLEGCLISDVGIFHVSVPLRGLWFLSAPFINGFMKPLKWHFAGRIIYFHYFSLFARK